MPRSANALPAALLAVLIGPALLTGAAPPPTESATPPPGAAAPPAKTTPHASAEPSEAQLPPVDPAWRRNGWHAVVPHAYVIRALVPARSRPEAGAPAAFWLKGGTRVPILEQRREWWRVGWSHGRSGWTPAADLQPHATFVLIDARTGRVLRRLAGRGQQGAISDGRCLWSFSDTGVTRMSLAEPPAIWSNPVHANQDDTLPEESVWTLDRSAFFVRANSDGTGPLVRVSAGTGAMKRIGYPGRYLLDIYADAKGRLLWAGDPGLQVYDPGSGQRIKAAGKLVAVARDGSIYAVAKSPDGKPELIHYDPDLKPLAESILGKAITFGCLSTDGRVLAVAGEDEERIELRRSDTFAGILTLHPGENDGCYPFALAAGTDGWWVLGGGDADFDDAITHYTQQGQHVRSWDADGRMTVVSPDGKAIYTARDSDLLAFDTTRGTIRRTPYLWRRPLPRRYLPKPSDPDTPTHLEVSALTLTPDGRTLILTEWLNGDPEG